MATTTTYGLNKPTVGGDENTWGQLTNDNWDDVDDLLDGTTAITPNLGAGWEVDGVAVTATAAELNQLDGAVVTASALSQLDALIALIDNCILKWRGSVASIPAGWQLADGTNGTPDLRDKFIVGAGGTYAVGATGGAATVTLTAAQIPSHTHAAGTLATTSAGAHSHVTNIYTASGGAFSGGSLGFAADKAGSQYEALSAGAHTHSITGSTGSAGSGDDHENLPPYYALCYIAKAA
jgi:microcystin-dependent protein